MPERIKKEIRKGLKNRIFRTERQRNLLKQISRYGKISFKKEYYHIKLRPSVKGAFYRTIDIGKPKGHQLIRIKIADKYVGYRWVTQKVIIQKNKLSKETLEIVKRAKKYQQ